jgi:hypothetical protein
MAIFFISIIDSDIGLFSLVGDVPTRSTCSSASCVMSCLIRPQCNGRSPHPTVSETADAINQSAKQAPGIVNLCPAEYHAVDVNHLPLDMVKPGPVLVA